MFICPSLSKCIFSFFLRFGFQHRTSLVLLSPFWAGPSSFFPLAPPFFAFTGFSSATFCSDKANKHQISRLPRVHWLHCIPAARGNRDVQRTRSSHGEDTSDTKEKNTGYVYKRVNMHNGRRVCVCVCTFYLDNGLLGLGLRLGWTRFLQIRQNPVRADLTQRTHSCRPTVSTFTCTLVLLLRCHSKCSITNKKIDLFPHAYTIMPSA